MEVNNPKNSTYIVIGVAVLFIVILIFQFVEDPNVIFSANLNDNREERDVFFRASPDSPIPDSLKRKFTVLDYFPPDVNYRMVAKFIRREKKDQIELERKGGDPAPYMIAGKLIFELEGKEHELTAYWEDGNSGRNLFIPFRDLTSGKTTYGGGRYLEARILNTSVQLDFNTAYNPYCVYDLNYVCPIPPEENFLDIAVEAGEKLFQY